LRLIDGSAADVAVLLLVELRQPKDGPLVVIDVPWLWCRRFRNQAHGRAIVSAIHNDDSEGVESVLSISGASWYLFQLLHDRNSVSRLAVLRDDGRPGREIEVVAPWTNELGRHVDHRETRSDGVRRVSVNREVTRVQLVVEARPSLDERCHARLGFEGDVDGPDREFHELRKRAEFDSRSVVEHDTDFLPLFNERPWAGGRGITTWTANYEIEVLLPTRAKVAHLMIETISDQSLFDVLAQQRTVPHEVEQDPPACDLGVMIAPGMVLPTVVVLETATGNERIDEEFRSEHSEARREF
jgi:hypothetical protein